MHNFADFSWWKRQTASFASDKKQDISVMCKIPWELHPQDDLVNNVYNIWCNFTYFLHTSPVLLNKNSLV